MPNNVVSSYGMPSNTIPTNAIPTNAIPINANMIKVIDSKKGDKMIYPIPNPMGYLEDYPIEHPMFVHPMVKYPIIRPYEENMGPPYPMVDII